MEKKVVTFRDWYEFNKGIINDCTSSQIFIYKKDKKKIELTSINLQMEVIADLKKAVDILGDYEIHTVNPSQVSRDNCNFKCFDIVLLN